MSRRVPTPPTFRTIDRRKSGQALLESFGIIMLLCLILFGSIQYVLLLTATEVIQYSADSSVRARAVGFNYFMVSKVAGVSSIPNAGAMLRPRTFVLSDLGWYRRPANRPLPPERAFFTAIRSSGRTSQYSTVEFRNIPLFLGSASPSEMFGYLHYENWEDDSDSRILEPVYTIADSGNIEVTMSQDFAFRMPLFRAFSDEDEMQIRRQSSLVDHAELYLE